MNKVITKKKTKVPATAVKKLPTQKAKVKPKTKAVPKTKTKVKPKTSAPQLSAKDAATARGEPYVNVVGMALDPKDLKQGAFELEYNSLFVASLVREGYRGVTDDNIVDQWFTTICRNVALETFEQDMADPEVRAKFNRKDLGNGRTEVS